MRPGRTCKCEFCTITRDLRKAAPDAKGWLYARLYRYYLDTVLAALEGLEKGDRLQRATIDETRELAGETDERFEKAMSAAGRESGPPPE